MGEKAYAVATVKPWNIELYRRKHATLPGHWQLLQTSDELSLARLASIQPRYIFFPHWSWIVPAEIVATYECVCFHMTDLPFGRGGSPLQNLIARGYRETQLTALRMDSGLDTGPIYFKRPMSLEGKAEDIYVRAAHIVWDMIAELVASEPTPTPQIGTGEVFARRMPSQSKLPLDVPLQALYDHIRMLDAPTYPGAFLDYGQWRLEFSDAELQEGGVEARVRIIRNAD